MMQLAENKAASQKSIANFWSLRNLSNVAGLPLPPRTFTIHKSPVTNHAFRSAFACLLDTLRTMLIACPLHVAQRSQVPPAPARSRNRRLSPLPLAQFRYVKSLSLAHGGASRQQRKHFAAVARPRGDLRLLRAPRSPLDAFFTHARENAFLECVQRAADGLRLPLHPGPRGRTDSASACRAERQSLHSAHVRSLFSRARFRHRRDRRPRGICPPLLRAPRLAHGRRRYLHEPRAFCGSGAA